MCADSGLDISRGRARERRRGACDATQVERERGAKRSERESRSERSCFMKRKRERERGDQESDAALEAKEGEEIRRAHVGSIRIRKERESEKRRRSQGRSGE